MSKEYPENVDGQISIYEVEETIGGCAQSMQSNKGLVDVEFAAPSDPIIHPEECIRNDTKQQISSVPEFIELSKEYDYSRHTLPMDNDVYLVLEVLMKMYEDRGAVVNALLTYGLTKVADGELVLRDRDQESRMNVLNKFYPRS